MVRLRKVPAAGFLLALAVSMGQSSPRPQWAEAAAVAIGEPVRPGTTVKAVVQVRVAPGFHIQSDRPRDPSLIPLTLTIDAPPGITVEGLVFPPAKDFTLKGTDQPLAVFEGAFPIEARLAIAREHRAGEVTVPARLRYQACDDTTCFRPMTIPVSWTLTVAGGGGRGAGRGASAAPAPPAAADPKPLSPPAVATPPEPTPVPGPMPAAPVAVPDQLQLFDEFEILGTAGGYLNKAEFLKFIDDAERGVKSQGLLEGKGPLAILAIVFLGGIALNLTPCVLPMIPVNLAIIGAGAGRAKRSLISGSSECPPARSFASSPRVPSSEMACSALSATS